MIKSFQANPNTLILHVEPNSKILKRTGHAFCMAIKTTQRQALNGGEILLMWGGDVNSDTELNIKDRA